MFMFMFMFKKSSHHVYVYVHVYLKSCRSDLVMWSKFLKEWNGVSFFVNDDIVNAADIQLFTDATMTSFGGYYMYQWFQGEFPVEMLDEQTSMAFFELYPIVMACVLWGHLWTRKRILFNCDNLAAVDIITKGRSKIPSIMKLMRKLTYHSAMHSYVIHAQHIAGKNNGIADSLSRCQMKKFWALAPQANSRPTPCLPATELMMD